MCHGRCGNGERHQSEKRESFRHWEQLAGAGDKLPKGGKNQLWRLPELLTEELMEEVALKQPTKKYVVDLFAGGESWRKSVEAQGYVYIPVDISKLVQRAAAQSAAIPV